MERLTRAGQPWAIAAAAMAHEFNDELTIILSSAANAMMALEPGHPARPELRELESAARRCARRCYFLLAFGERQGVRPARAPLESVVEV